ncbi:hypothetical protein R5R35_013157 [Gryllus longicercus]|uniref:Receptor protein-tyrosine kinase n=1 Tax=Gryllus longicercus TaxID=2509291 RepID=A0AAN9V8P9_9ORTH
MGAPWRLLLVLLAALGGCGPCGANAVIEERVCIGTNGRISVPSNREHHYRNLRERYTNCTYVDGNLEVTWLEDPQLDLSFLQHIREVTGYVLISHVNVPRVVLPALQIIRGRTLFRIAVHDEDFALMILLSKMNSLEMPALRDILQGNVGLLNNYNLCHIRTINWDDIITGPGAHVVHVYNFTMPERECPPCHSSCENGCWGEGPHNCQKFSKINCSPQCHQGRCFGTNPRECCHLFCAGGCRGPKQSDCLACRNFYDNGVCTQECPPMQRYNSITYSWESNPDGKYAYGATCVKKCPDHLLKDNGACVRSCPQNKRAVEGECVQCDGPCPKKCEGESSVHSGNIEKFKNCTIIEGSISILDTSFKGFQQIYTNYTFGERYEPMHPDRLEVFSTLKEITGYLHIDGSHQDFRNLSYFRNLETIGGRQLTDYFASLYIVKTTLTSFGLKSLKKISSGSIAILENPDLCFAESLNWTRIKASADHSVLQGNNRKTEECIAAGMVCDKECSDEGCWGPGADQCLSCAHFHLGSRCIHNCNSLPGIYQSGEKMCSYCHEECASTCNGPGPGNCTSCKHTKDGPFCTAECPVTKYASENGECKPCHSNCVDGCTGPHNTVGSGGCNSCEKAIINGNVTVGMCLQKNESCPDGYYNEYMGPQEQGSLKPLEGKAICRSCHPRCKKCTGYGFHEQVCQECALYKRGEQCEDECPFDHYAVESHHECMPCDQECRECYGPTNSECKACRNMRLWTDTNHNSSSFNCTGTCPPEMPYKIFPIVPSDGEPYCSNVQQEGVGGRPDIITSYPTMFGIGVFVCLSIIAGLAMIFWVYRRKAKAKENAVKMTMVMTGLEDNEPLRPTNVKPNLAKLRIVKEAELRKGSVLGYGAFGTVYKGVWVPEGENIKIPVAIKVLREGTSSNTSKEFLEEAYIMASVEHPNLLQLLAVCLASQMMLVTQLMPLGCLLDYVRNNRERVGSKPLLNWCTQIARGMAYLEEKRLVHRDLAARNVLVQTPTCVKITDFGLAKLLAINEDEYKAAGGKMPIKWLALECIQHRIFTHKSDVWAFGVTVWELLTYGGRPYESVPARDVPELLEKGERLPQPTICTIDVYLLMIKCWMLDAESRPSFKELADEFAAMARDPGRFLVIQGDRFMKLPSYSGQDEKEMIRNLSSPVEGPEALVDADEYLQPKSRAPLGPALTSIDSSSSSSPPHPCSKRLWTASADSPTPQNQQNWNREALQCGPAPLCRDQSSTRSSDEPDCGSTRYCSDPLKMVGTRESEGLSDPCHAVGLPSRCEAQVGTLKLELPLDDDDYLMPSPQQSQSTTTYMDLISDTKIIGKGKSGVDNPEYHVMREDAMAMPAHTIGIPTDPAERVAPRLHLPQHKSSEEESDHEYYNDFDRLQRELQPLKPLRRNETTV